MLATQNQQQKQAQLSFEMADKSIETPITPFKSMTKFKFGQATPVSSYRSPFFEPLVDAKTPHSVSHRSEVASSETLRSEPLRSKTSRPSISSTTKPAPKSFFFKGIEVLDLTTDDDSGEEGSDNDAELERLARLRGPSTFSTVFNSPATPRRADPFGGGLFDTPTKRGQSISTTIRGGLFDVPTGQYSLKGIDLSNLSDEDSDDDASFINALVAAEKEVSSKQNGCATNKRVLNNINTPTPSTPQKSTAIDPRLFLNHASTLQDPAMLDPSLFMTPPATILKKRPATILDFDIHNPKPTEPETPITNSPTKKLKTSKDCNPHVTTSRLNFTRSTFAVLAQLGVDLSSEASTTLRRHLATFEARYLEVENARDMARFVVKDREERIEKLKTFLVGGIDILNGKGIPLLEVDGEFEE